MQENKSCTMKKLFAALGLLCFSMLISIPSADAQSIREKNKNGNPFLVLNKNVLHLKGPDGIGLYYCDGTTVRVSSASGAPLYFIDASTVRSVNKSGEPLLYFDGLNIREKDASGKVLYFLDGRTLKRGGEKGEAAYYFEVIPEKWILACLVFLDRL